MNNYRIEEFTAPKELEVIEHNAFTNSSIKKLVIKGNIEYIGFEAFSYCKELEEVYIESECLNIMDFAFAYCPNLKKISIKGHANIYPNAFIGSNNIS